MIHSNSSGAQLTAALGDEWSVLALWGAPGVGKSHLVRKLFPCDTSERWIHVSLASAGDAASVSRQLAQAIHSGTLNLGEGVALLARLLNAEAPLGLVLDDADGATAWLEHCLPELCASVPDLRVVVTSRERPDGVLGQLASARALEVQPLPEAEAQDLFRRFAARLGVQLEGAHEPFVAQLCHELGGLPLALELAAARLDVMPVPALLHRIRSQGLPRNQSAADRHASLDAALVSSWQGLEPPAQASLMLLAWPPRGATLSELEGALDLVSGGEGFPPSASALDVSSGLRRRAWLLRDGERLTLPPPLRRFVLERSSAERSERIALAWAEHFASQAGVRAPFENLEAVLARAMHAPQLSTRYADAALRVISRGLALPLALGNELGPALERVLAKVVERSQSSGASLPLISEAMSLQARAQLARGEARGAAALALRALDFARRAGRTELELLALLSLARGLAEAGHYGDATSALERARDLVGSSTELWRSFELAEGYWALRDLDGARVQAERCLARVAAREEADGLCSAAIQLLLADVCVETGDEALAERRLSEAEGEIHRATITSQVSRGLVETLRLRLIYGRGRGAVHAQRLAAAESCFAEAVTGLAARGATRSLALARYHLGITRRELGQAGAAFVELELALAQLTPGSREWAFCALHLAQLEREARAESRALAWFGQVREHAQRVGLTDLAELASALSRGGPSPYVAERSLRELDLRVLERCASRRHTQSLRSEPDSWLVARDGAWFRAPGGQQVPLGKRKALSAILAALAEAREAGSGCPRAELIEAGWPGERILEAAATQRLRVALSTLRKLGLEPLIRTLDDGYALGSDVPVARV